jgi:hypothetical protein
MPMPEPALASAPEPLGEEATTADEAAATATHAAADATATPAAEATSVDTAANATSTVIAPASAPAPQAAPAGSGIVNRLLKARALPEATVSVSSAAPSIWLETMILFAEKLYYKRNLLHKDVDVFKWSTGFFVIDGGELRGYRNKERQAS